MGFDEYFKISTTAMRLNRCHPAIARDKVWITQFIFICVMCTSCFTLLLYSILLHDIRNKEYTNACKSCIMAIVSVTISFKYAVLVIHQDSINYLISIINRDYDLAETFPDDEKRIVMHYKEKGIKVCKLWLAIAVASTVIFPLKAFLLMGYLHAKGEFKLVPMFELTYPSFIETYKNIFTVYCALFVLCTAFACYASTMYLGFDPLVPIFMLHCCGQLEVVCRRIMRLLSETTDEREIREKLKKLILKLQEIYGFVDHIKHNFTILYEFTMKTTTFLLPLSAFQVVECLRKRDTNLEFIPFCFGTIIHFYMPCYYSDLLMEKSESLRQSIYSCGWEMNTDKGTKKTILFMLARATRPLVITTVFFPICLDTFAEMCRNSYAIFNIMNAAWT
ncbi:odorant receptor 2a-like [Pectinophora gossypiella]|uniref:odorant receptor 2a-like n=1 Tax=Pectinophora gossypiella TaxID=13191 RepID=UPI00214F21C8|nr:odorant receptor 2a-like [Pectinophora gossypiella]